MRTRALALKDQIKGTDVYDEYASSLRTGGESNAVIQWIIDVQVSLLERAKPQILVTAQDFGMPADEPASVTAYFDGRLPSIKMTKETIAENSPVKPGPTMHDTPPRPVEE